MNYDAGTQIGDYQILSVLGTGGMGKVYKVRNTISDRVEAMKILLPDLASQQALADRFLREIKVLASLNHPNIAALHTALRVENQLLMIMELVEGVTLGEKLQAGPIPLSDALTYADQALSALSYAHHQGVIHRDIKPANMMLTPQGVLKLMDFGIARAPSDTKLTMTGTTLGSLHYMSPEQVKGGPLDARSDLYSLGVVLYEMATGKRPFQEASEYSVMAAHLEKPPQPPIEINPSLPPSLNAVILIALAKDPARRFQSADAFRTALGNVAGAPAPGRVPAAAPPTPSATATSVVAAAGPPQTPRPQAGPVQPSAATTPIPPPSRSGGYRGLYMALGALVVVIVIVASAIELPRWMKTRAGEKVQAPAVTQSPAATPATTATAPAATPAPSQAVSSSESQSATATSAAAPPASAAKKPSTPPAAAAPASGASAANSARPKPEAARAHPVKTSMRSSHRSKPTVASGAAAAAAALPAAAPVAGSAQQSAPTPPPAASSATASGAVPGSPPLQSLQDRMDKLSSRASAVDQSLKTLQQQQASSGLNLRGDVTASWIRMKGFMDRADAALAAGDGASAKRYMDRAEHEVDFLEKFLGR